MNSGIIKGRWEEIKGKIRKKWAKFTEDEINQMEGSEEELESALQKKYGYKEEDARKFLKAFLNEHRRDE